jgi:transposase InsO family protein
MSDKHSIKDLCEKWGFLRRGYYQWKNTGQSLRAQQTNRLKRLIENEYEKSRQTYGSPRITRALRNGVEAVGYNRVVRLMRFCRSTRPAKAPISSEDHRQSSRSAHRAQSPEVASTPTKPDPIWATDITYIETDEGWLYLAGVLDLHSRRRIGWSMGPSWKPPCHWPHLTGR